MFLLLIIKFYSYKPRERRREYSNNDIDSFGDNNSKRKTYNSRGPKKQSKDYSDE